MKKIVSIALVLLLIVSMLPMAVFASESKATDIVDTTGKAAGDKITLGGVEYTLIDSADDVVAADGNYYLLNDITLTTYFLADKDNGNNGAADESSFVGKFNGGGHTITLDGAKSVFGKWFGGEGFVVANLTLATKDNAVFAPAKWGSPLGFYACKGGLFYNVTNNINIETTQANVGGLVGGISGATAPAEFVNCVNNGTIKAGGSNAGIVGYVNKNSTVSLQNCVNNANITSTANFGAGGLVGYIGACSLSVTDSVNYGDVVTKLAYAGGILGGAHKPEYSALTLYFKNCINFGDISTTASSTYMIGGISGGSTYTYNDEFTFDSCINFGDLTTQGNRVAGMMAVNSTGKRPTPYGDNDKCVITVKNCYNAGTFTTTDKTPVALIELVVFTGNTKLDGTNSVPADFEGTLNVSNSYTSVEMEKIVDVTGSTKFTSTVDAETVGTTTLDKVVAAANAMGILEETLYVKDGAVASCTEHNYTEGVCGICGAEDPNYVPPQPEDPKPEDPKPEDPAPTSDITVYALAIALVSLAGVVVAKKKIRE